jgi:hypothetical protein
VASAMSGHTRTVPRRLVCRKAPDELLAAMTASKRYAASGPGCLHIECGHRPRSAFRTPLKQLLCREMHSRKYLNKLVISQLLQDRSGSIEEISRVPDHLNLVCPTAGTTEALIDQ